MIKFEKINKYKDVELPLPVRGTANSAGYDFIVAEDIIVPSYWKIAERLQKEVNLTDKAIGLNDLANVTKSLGLKPTLVPTGMKCYLESDTYLELSVRSSTPLKYWLVLANGVGIIDADYADNPDNEGHIYFQLINLSPIDIQLKKGDKIGQGIIKQYMVTDDDTAAGKRKGGFGSTTIMQASTDPDVIEYFIR